MFSFSSKNTIAIGLAIFSFLNIANICAAPISNPTSPVLVLSGSATQTILVGSGETLFDSLIETDVANAFVTGGTAQGWRSDDSDWNYVLPFSFTYYGVTYATGHTIKVSSNGRICFDNTQSCNATSGNIAYGPYGPQIAPLWRDLYTAYNPTDDIYITENSGSVIIRWQATSCCGPDYPVNFSVTLFQNGQIRFDYGDQSTPYVDIYQTIGVSSGDEVHYTNSPKASLASYDYISGSLWTYAYGYKDPGATRTDDYDGTGMLVATSGSVDINTPGTYILEYTYTNSQSRTTTVTRTVNVVTPDSIAPVVTLVGSGTIILAQGATWFDSGATWFDNVDGSGTITIASSGTVNSSVVGSYILQYIKIDIAGNTGSVTRTVNVVDLTAPVVTLVGSGTITLAQGATWSDSGATWSDNIDGTGTITAASSGAINTSIAGTYTLQYTKVDTAGNTGSITRTVVINAPVSSGGGGGGGGGSASSVSTNTTTTPAVVSTSVNPSTATTQVITQETFTSTTATPKNKTVITTTTTLKKGTQINVYRTLDNGKKIKVGTTRVINGIIKFTIKQKGKYTFEKK